MRDLNIISLDNYSQNILKVMDLDLQKAVSIKKKDLICSLGIQTDLDPKYISEENKTNAGFYELIYCLNPQNSDFKNLYLNILQNEKNPELRVRGAIGLAHFKALDLESQMILARRMKSDESSNVRTMITNQFAWIGSASLEAQRMLADTMRNDVYEYARLGAAYALCEIKTRDSEIIKMIETAASTDTHSGVREYAAQALKNINENSGCNPN